MLLVTYQLPVLKNGETVVTVVTEIKYQNYFRSMFTGTDGALHNTIHFVVYSCLIIPLANKVWEQKGFKLSVCPSVLQLLFYYSLDFYETLCSFRLLSLYKYF